MRLLLLATLLFPTAALAQIAEFRVTAALDTLAQIAEVGDASPLTQRLACRGEDGDAAVPDVVVPCVYQGAPRMEDTSGALLLALRDALPPDAGWVPDAIALRTVEGRVLTEVQLKVRRDGDLIGQPVLRFADHPTRPLLVQVNGGPSMLLRDTPAAETPALLDLPILTTPDLSVQLPARTSLLQAMAAGEVPRDEAAALLACRVVTDDTTTPVPCSYPGIEEDPAERVQQVFDEFAFIFGDARIDPAADAVVAPYEMQGFAGAQVQFEIENGGATRRPTLFFFAHDEGYLFVSAHPDMSPLAPPVTDAQPRLETLLADLLTWARTGNAKAAAPHFVYRGDGPDRWRRALDPADPDDQAAAQEALDQLARVIGTYETYDIQTYFAEAESEGTWHVLEVAFERAEETESVVFAFLLVDEVFVLGDLD